MLQSYDYLAFYAHKGFQRHNSIKREIRPVYSGKTADGDLLVSEDIFREVKKMGFDRGSAWFEYKDELKKKGLVPFSTNRVMMILKDFQEVEVYSIDEAFHKVEGTRDELLAIAKNIRSKLQVGWAFQFLSVLDRQRL